MATKGRIRMKKIVIVLFALIAVGCWPFKPKPKPTPTPTPVVTPTPNPFESKPGLSVKGRDFIDPSGNRIWLAGWVVCCGDTIGDGWPLIDPVRLKFYSQYGNWTHIRLGPFTENEEDGQKFIAYKPVGDGKYDLTQWNDVYWEKIKNVLKVAEDVGVYIEIDLIDAWVMESRNNSNSPWMRRNNINNIDDGMCLRLHEDPKPIHQEWIKKAIKETGWSPMVMYEVGNETMDCDGLGTTKAWEFGIRDLVRQALKDNGYHYRLISTNSHKHEWETEFDYANWHRSETMDYESCPIGVNETPPDFQGDEWQYSFMAAKRNGTFFHLWRGDRNDEVWKSDLEFLRDNR